MNKKFIMTLFILVPALLISSFFLLAVGGVQVKIPQTNAANNNTIEVAGTSDQNLDAEINQEESVSAFAGLTGRIYSNPLSLNIETLEIDINIVPVGVTEDGYMETPQNWKEGGWFKRSSKPGEIGNMVISAHYDDNTGAPAAFWRLKNIKLDDKVLVSDKYGKNFYYKVIDTFLVDINDPDKLEIIEDSSEKSELTLITCGGVWIPGKSTYNKRFVVKAELVPEDEG